MNLNRCYQILGLDPSASPEQVRHAYLEAVKTWHPDRFDGSALLKQEAEETLKRINAAYALINAQRPAQRPGNARAAALCRQWAGIFTALATTVVRQLAENLKAPASRQPDSATRGESSGPRATTAKTFRQVLDEVGNRPSFSSRTGHSVDAGRRWLRLLQQRRQRRREGLDVEGIEAVGPSRPVQGVRRVPRP